MRLIDLDSDSDYLLDGRYAIHGRDSVPSTQQSMTATSNTETSDTVKIPVFDGTTERLPSAQPERKKGKWEVCNILDYAQRPSGRRILRCPFCGYLTDEFRSLVDYYHKLTHFCPSCGAKMEVEHE